MKYLKINGTEIPCCAVGTWAWGSGMNGAGMVFGNVHSEEQLTETFEKATELGFTLWDTAAVYGLGSSEQLLGKLFEKCDRYQISTKYTPRDIPGYGSVEQVLTRSLLAVHKESADIYWLHQPINIKENLAEFIRLYKHGKILNIGISNFNLKQIKQADEMLKAEGLKLFGVQNHYSLIYRQSEQAGILDWCKENSTAFFSYMILEQGALTGKYTKSAPLPKFSRRGMAFSKRKLDKLTPLINTLTEIGSKYSANASQINIAWAIAKGTVPIIGITKAYQAEELSKAINIELTKEEITTLEKVAESTGVSIKAGWEKEMC
jgi:aryl-alcohol dehydrogenase-like predicted oxidoreductase